VAKLGSPIIKKIIFNCSQKYAVWSFIRSWDVLVCASQLTVNCLPSAFDLWREFILPNDVEVGQKLLAADRRAAKRLVAKQKTVALEQRVGQEDRTRDDEDEQSHQQPGEEFRRFSRFGSIYIVVIWR